MTSTIAHAGDHLKKGHDIIKSGSVPKETDIPNIITH